MRIALVGVVALGLLCLPGCGGSGDTAKRRAAVNAYFDRVDKAELPLLSKVGEIDLAFQRFSLTKTTPGQLRALVLARARIRAALRRVSAIKPPADARRVHATLVQVLSLQAAVAGELVRAAEFIPRFAAIGPPLRAAASALGRDLSAVKQPPSTSKPTGEQLWNAAGCGTCHVLAASGSKGASGPSLDTVRPSAAAVAAQVRDGSKAMPSYRKALTGEQIAAIASYVAAAAGNPSARPGAGATASAPAGPDVYAQYAAVFADYRLAIAPILARLDRLNAPPELRPVLVAQRRALERSASLCTEIEADLGRHDVEAANKAIQTLFSVARDVNSAEVAREQAAAARASNARLATIAKLTAKVARERQQLQNKLR